MLASNTLPLNTAEEKTSPLSIFDADDGAGEGGGEVDVDHNFARESI